MSEPAIIAVRMAEGAVDAIHAFKAYAAMYAETAPPGEFSAQKALTNVIRFINGPDSLILLAMDGASCAGVLTLAKFTFWFSETGRGIEDKGLYVLPPYRGGPSLRLLLAAAAALGDDVGMPVFITINNARRKRGGASSFERIGATIGYEPRGAVLAHFPPATKE